MRTLLLAAVLALAPLLPAASASIGDVDTVDVSGCAPPVYTGHDDWYEVCVDPKGGACAVTITQVRGGGETTVTCIPDHVYVVPPSPRCVLLGHDLDYSHYLCVDPSDPACAVYLWSVSGGHDVKRCYLLFGDVSIGGVDLAASCIPTSGGLDYHSYLCIDPRNPRCVVYTIQHTDWGTQKRCVPGV